MQWPPSPPPPTSRYQRPQQPPTPTPAICLSTGCTLGGGEAEGRTGEVANGHQIRDPSRGNKMSDLHTTGGAELQEGTRWLSLFILVTAAPAAAATTTAVPTLCVIMYIVHKQHLMHRNVALVQNDCTLMHTGN